LLTLESITFADVFFHNSWGGKGVPPPGYQPAWVILDGKDPSKM